MLRCRQLANMPRRRDPASEARDVVVVVVVCVCGVWGGITHTRNHNIYVFKMFIIFTL